MKLTQKAQVVLDRVNAGEHPNDMEEIAEIMDWSCSDGFEYGLWDGGYIKPELILVGEDLERVQNASKVLEEFKSLWEKISYEF